MHAISSFGPIACPYPSLLNCITQGTQAAHSAIQSPTTFLPTSWAALPEMELERVDRGLSESRRATTHDLALAHQLGVELGPVQREVDIEVDAVERALRRIHPLEVLLQILP